MDSSELDYNLPEERIARFPSRRRDACKLLAYSRRTGEIAHAKFADLPDILEKPHNFFRNSASVLKARIFARKPTGGEVECLLLSPLDGGREWLCMLKPGRRLPAGSRFGIDGVFSAEVLSKDAEGNAAVRFDTFGNGGVIEMSERVGVVPLPPYIARDQKSPDYDRDFDNEYYQTVYADPSKRVAAAAPTAGLHFTAELDERLRARGHAFHSLTLHVGLGTFRPMKTERVEDFQIHSEIYEIRAETLSAMGDASRPKLAVGTTSLRAMEDYWRKNGAPPRDCARSVADSAKIFVYPPQRILSADALVTNFHLPRSSLMCLVAAFLSPGNADGVKMLKDLYRIAIDKKYDFYSYGDAMLIL